MRLLMKLCIQVQRRFLKLASRIRMWDELRTGTPPRCRLAITTGFTAVTPPPASLMAWEVMSNHHHPVMYVIVGLRSHLCIYKFI